MGSPRHVLNRRQRTREGPEPACVQTPLPRGWHTQGCKDEITSRRGTVKSAWQKLPVSRKQKREPGCPKRASGRHVVRGRQSSPTLEVRPGEQARLVKTAKIQVKWAATQPGQDRRLPRLKALAGDLRPIQGGDRPRRRLRGRYRLGHRPVVLLRTETAQCTVRLESRTVVSR